MKPNSRIVGLLVFIALVAAVQIAEGLLRWYIHREDRVHLVALREELIDVGAEMIGAQLDAERLREQLEAIDHALDSRRHDFHRARPHVGRTALRNLSSRAQPDDVSSFNVQVLERNRRLNDLNGLVSRRNAAAVRYYVLADSIRMIAERAREPYFSIPLPAEAAVQRGVTSVMVPWNGATRDPLVRGAAVQVPRLEQPLP